jgi:hypothetical protein
MVTIQHKDGKRNHYNDIEMKLPCQIPLRYPLKYPSRYCSNSGQGRTRQLGLGIGCHPPLFPGPAGGVPVHGRASVGRG